MAFTLAEVQAYARDAAETSSHDPDWAFRAALLMRATWARVSYEAREAATVPLEHAPVGYRKVDPAMLALAERLEALVRGM